MADTRMRFEKWNGLGNDFLVTRDERALHVPFERIAALCDRRRGVGGDGVLVVTGMDDLRPRMTVRNADGSVPEMCGNGLRCVAGFVLEEVDRDARQRSEATRALVVETDAGPKRCTARRTGASAWEVEIEMGVARAGATFRVPASDGRELHFEEVNVGNPHAICWDGWLPSDVDELGPALSRRPPAGTNVEFCTVREGRIDVVVYERGVGRTLACGTGATAVAWLAHERGRAPVAPSYVVGLPGGDLAIGVRAGGLTLRGPAERVFEGGVTL